MAFGIVTLTKSDLGESKDEVVGIGISSQITFDPCHTSLIRYSEHVAGIGCPTPEDTVERKKTRCCIQGFNITPVPSFDIVLICRQG